MDSRSSNEPRIDPEEILTGVKTWVEIETPSYHGEEVNKLVDVVEESMQALGAEIIRIPGRDGFGDILKARTSWGHPGEQPGILVLSHLDTVHPMGTLDGKLKWTRDGDKVQGPGIYDMKAGAYLAYVPFSSFLFDRIMAATRFAGTAVFAVNLADAVGYTGSVAMQLFKDLGHGEMSRLQFFRGVSYLLGVGGAAILGLALFYFVRQAQQQPVASHPSR